MLGPQKLNKPSASKFLMFLRLFRIVNDRLMKHPNHVVLLWSSTRPIDHDIHTAGGLLDYTRHLATMRRHDYLRLHGDKVLLVSTI